MFAVMFGSWCLFRCSCTVCDQFGFNQFSNAITGWNSMICSGAPLQLGRKVDLHHGSTVWCSKWHQWRWHHPPVAAYFGFTFVQWGKLARCQPSLNAIYDLYMHILYILGCIHTQTPFELHCNIMFSFSTFQGLKSQSASQEVIN